MLTCQLFKSTYRKYMIITTSLIFCFYRGLMPVTHGMIWHVDRLTKTCQIMMSTCQIFMLTWQILCRLVRYCCYLYDINWARTRSFFLMSEWQVNIKIWQSTYRSDDLLSDKWWQKYSTIENTLTFYEASNNHEVNFNKSWQKTFDKRDSSLYR